MKFRRRQAAPSADAATLVFARRTIRAIALLQQSITLVPHDAAGLAYVDQVIAFGREASVPLDEAIGAAS